MRPGEKNLVSGVTPDNTLKNSSEASARSAIAANMRCSGGVVRGNDANPTVKSNIARVCRSRAF
jgi:hypothetical protein